MALYLSLFSLPDSHIDYLKANPHDVCDYLHGELTQVEKKSFRFRSPYSRLSSTAAMPPFPTQPLDSFNPLITHRDVELHHFILNGSAEYVSGAGSIFQTWVSHTHSAIPMDRSRENFAFKHEKVPELLNIVAHLSDDDIRSRYIEWFSLEHPDFNPHESEIRLKIEEFETFKQGLEEAATNKLGLIWTSD